METMIQENWEIAQYRVMSDSKELDLVVHETGIS